MKNKCALCGEPCSGRYCKGIHTKKCAYCEKEFSLDFSVSSIKQRQRWSKKDCCSSKCTNFERYGVEHHSKLPEFREKVTRTNLKKFGVEFASQSETIKSKVKQTNLERYGVDNPLGSEKIRSKATQTNLEKYGHENIFGSEIGKKKVKEGMLRNWGVEYTLQSPAIKKKVKNTNIKRYGVEFASQSETIKSKVKQTNLERYGVDNVFASEYGKEKIRQTNLERYGTENPSQLKEIRKKAKKTTKEKYGHENIFGSEYGKEKIRQTNLERYGVSHPRKSEKARLQSGVQFHSDEKIVDFITSNPGQTIYRLSKHFRYIGTSSMGSKISRLGLQQYVKYNDSHVNQHWHDLLSDKLNTTIEREVSVFSNPRCKADLFLPEFNIGIDINPTVSHSTQPTGHPHYQPKTVKYHQERALDAEANGYQLIQIYDWDDPDKIVALLQSLTSKDKIGARQCVLKSISKTQAKEFLNKHHRQGYGSARWCYGLSYEDTLVAVMTFGLGRFGHEGFELQRYASSIRIQGGQSRLFKAFVKDQDPDHVYSYVSLDTGTGRSYENFMTYKRLASLNGQYCHLETGHRIKATNQKGKRKDELNEAGYFRINDAGNKVFEWKSN